MSKETKTRLSLGVILMAVGLVIFVGAVVAAGGDFLAFSTVEYETTTHDIADAFTDISVDTTTADITILPSKDGKCTVTCHDEKNVHHTVAVKNGTLTIEQTDDRKWYEHIGIGFESTAVTVYLPEAEYGKLSVNATTGDIGIESITLDALDLDLSTGRVTVADAQITGNVTVTLSTGDTHLTDTRCKNLISTGSTGDVTLKNVVASESFSIDRSTGDVVFRSCDAAEITVSTSTGDITGTLTSDKVFIADATTGRVSVPDTASGGRCKLTTTTGDIDIEIE